MLIAGEASGDTLGAELVEALKAECGGQDFEFIGAGGPKMAGAGVQLAFDLSAHAVVGIWEVLKNYGKFKAFFNELLALAAERKPDFVILIDYPGFNLRFAKALRASARWKPRIIYYVSPQIWAWHESRVHQIARDIDLMLAIFPFEKSWYAARKPDFKVEFVGHPLIERHARQAPPPSAERTLLLLPGSRVRELRQHLPPMLAAARRIGGEIEMVLPDERLRELAGTLGDLSGIRVQIGGLAEALARARVAIASSGTVTMECACFGVPTVVIYKTSWSTHFLGRRFIRVKYLAMPNLLADTELYPELIQNAATAGNIAAAAENLLHNEPRRAAIKAQLRAVISSLGGPGASLRAARAILSLPD
jgi:lipid-A-disaccharide synthase